MCGAGCVYLAHDAQQLALSVAQALWRQWLLQAAAQRKHISTYTEQITQKKIKRN